MVRMVGVLLSVDLLLLLHVAYNVVIAGVLVVAAAFFGYGAGVFLASLLLCLVTS